MKIIYIIYLHLFCHFSYRIIFIGYIILYYIMFYLLYSFLFNYLCFYFIIYLIIYVSILPFIYLFTVFIQLFLFIYSCYLNNFMHKIWMILLLYSIIGNPRTTITPPTLLPIPLISITTPTLTSITTPIPTAGMRSFPRLLIPILIMTWVQCTQPPGLILLHVIIA